MDGSVPVAELGISEEDLGLEKSETPGNTEVVKPKALYHASANREITILEPRAETVRDKNEGPAVFASPDKAGVTQFLVPSDDTWTRKMRLNGVPIHVISNRERYAEADKGGAIYELSPETFNLDNSKGGGKGEWTSKSTVTPTSKEVYESGLQAQLDSGVQVYFVDKQTLDQINQAEDHGKSILQGLASENKIKNINPKDIPDELDQPPT